MTYISIILIAYLVGSIPFSLVISWLTNKQDIRQLGTGNAGASNTYLVIGPIAALLTAILDILKGLIPTAFVWMFFKNEAIVGLVGIAAICGHIWPVFFGFKGGKGVATAFGVFLFISWKMAILALGVWALLVLTSKYLTMSNILIIICMPLGGILFGVTNEYIIALIGIAILISFSHRSNIQSFIKGEEPTLQDSIKRVRRNK